MRRPIAAGQPIRLEQQHGALLPLALGTRAQDGRFAGAGKPYDVHETVRRECGFRTRHDRRARDVDPVDLMPDRCERVPGLLVDAAEVASQRLRALKAESAMQRRQERRPVEFDGAPGRFPRDHAQPVPQISGLRRVTKVAAQPFDRVDHVGRSGVKRVDLDQQEMPQQSQHGGIVWRAAGERGKNGPKRPQDAPVLIVGAAGLKPCEERLHGNAAARPSAHLV
jgi:hypothetical protein